MALENFTAAFAHALLARPELLRDAPDELARLWRWHSIEEIEHKAVAYDVLMHALADLSDFDAIITDAAPASDDRAAIDQAGLRLTIARD